MPRVKGAYPARNQHSLLKEQGMSGMVKVRERLSMSEKFSRFSGRLRDPEWRRYFGLIMVGKAVGVAVLLLAVLAIMTYMKTGTVWAQTTAPTTAPAATTMPVMSTDLADMTKNPTI